MGEFTDDIMLQIYRHADDNTPAALAAYARGEPYFPPPEIQRHFDIIRQHLEALVEAIDAANDQTHRLNPD